MNHKWADLNAFSRALPPHPYVSVFISLHACFQRSDQCNMPSKKCIKTTQVLCLSHKMVIFMFTSLLCFSSVVCKRINTVICLSISCQGLPSASRPPRVLSYPKPHAKLMTVVFLSAPLPRPFKHNECVKTVLWLYMKRLWTVWGVQRNQTSLQRGGESSSVFAEWNLSTRLFDSPRSNSACQQWRI